MQAVYRYNNRWSQWLSIFRSLARLGQILFDEPDLLLLVLIPSATETGNAFSDESQRDSAGRRMFNLVWLITLMSATAPMCNALDSDEDDNDPFQAVRDFCAVEVEQRVLQL